MTKPLSKAELKRQRSRRRTIPELNRKHKGRRKDKALPAPATQSDTLTVEEVAARLRIGRNQAYEAVRKGKIPALHIGERWLIPRAAFERLMRGEPLNLQLENRRLPGDVGRPGEISTARHGGTDGGPFQPSKQEGTRRPQMSPRRASYGTST